MSRAEQLAAVTMHVGEHEVALARHDVAPQCRHLAREVVASIDDVAVLASSQSRSREGGQSRGTCRPAQEEGLADAVEHLADDGVGHGVAQADPGQTVGLGEAAQG